jgi:predicted AAA+ superfamily ATPase
MPDRTIRRGEFVARHAERPVRAALADTRIVAIVGPRQSGKTTLARRIAAADGRPFITLDDDQFRRFARNDPAGFMRAQPAAVIDEIQRAPSLVLALNSPW